MVVAGVGTGGVVEGTVEVAARAGSGEAEGSLVVDDIYTTHTKENELPVLFARTL